MTTQELIRKFNTEFETTIKRPETFVVDAETYGNVCHSVIQSMRISVPSFVVELYVGSHGGLMFKGVELLLMDNN